MILCQIKAKSTIKELTLTGLCGLEISIHILQMSGSVLKREAV